MYYYCLVCTTGTVADLPQIRRKKKEEIQLLNSCFNTAFWVELKQASAFGVEQALFSHQSQALGSQKFIYGPRFLSEVIGQRPRKYLSCCSCSFPFVSFPS